MNEVTVTAATNAIFNDSSCGKKGGHAFRSQDGEHILIPSSVIESSQLIRAGDRIKILFQGGLVVGAKICR